MSDDKRAAERIMEDLPSWMKAFKLSTKPEKDKFEGFRAPDYLDRRWEPSEL